MMGRMQKQDTSLFRLWTLPFLALGIACCILGGLWEPAMDLAAAQGWVEKGAAPDLGFPVFGLGITLVSLAILFNVDRIYTRRRPEEAS